MANIEKCKICGFIAFHVQMSGHFTWGKHGDADYESNVEVVGDTDADYARYGFRPSIQYYRDKLAGKKVSPFDYRKRKR